MEVKEIIELMKAMSDNGMTGFELEEGDWKLTHEAGKENRCGGADTGRYAGAPGQGSMIQTGGCDRYGAGLR